MLQINNNNKLWDNMLFSNVLKKISLMSWLLILTKKTFKQTYAKISQQHNSAYKEHRSVINI